MIRKLIIFPSSLPALAHLALALVAIALFVVAKGYLDASYVASNHPVDYATGQTGFNGGLIKQYYAHMQNLGTLGVYWTTQFIDFSFITGVFLIGLFVPTGLARLARFGSLARKTGVIAAGALMFGALSDVIENLISFVMLAMPTDFSNWIAWPYSGFAVTKFALMTTGMALVIVTLLLITVGRLFAKPKIG